MKPVQRDLIFDIGADIGDDTAYYLHRGYRVVAVEPNPASAVRLRKRFAEEMSSGRLTLAEAAISSEAGHATFWICDDLPAWSSFDRQMASKNRSRHHCIHVETCTFSSLLERFGIPIYCKIDIEGSDGTCLNDLTENAKPPFVSVEMTYTESRLDEVLTLGLVERLCTVGYRRFKVISQVTYRQPSKWIALSKALAPWRVSIRITRLQGRFRRYRPEEGWGFDGHGSGPFGEETHGDWLTAAQVRGLIAIVARNRDTSDWFDIHAAE